MSQTAPKPEAESVEQRLPPYDEMLDMPPLELERAIARAAEARGICVQSSSGPGGGITGYLKE